jgi:hypothetical protein
MCCDVYKYHNSILRSRVVVMTERREKRKRKSEGNVCGRGGEGVYDSICVCDRAICNK